MNWYSVGLAAFSGALAALVVSLIFAKQSERRVFALLLFLMLFAGFNALSKQYILPYFNASRLDTNIQDALANIRAFESIKNHEPETYESLVASLQGAIQQGYSEAQITHLIQTQVSAIVERRLPKASDQAIIDFIGVVIAQITELQAKGGDLCFHFLYPIAGKSVDVRKHLSAELLNKDLAALDLTIRSYDENRRIPDQQEVGPLFQSIYARLFEEFGNAVMSLENPLLESVDKNGVCNITKSMYSHILKLEPSNAVALLRWMLSQY